MIDYHNMTAGTNHKSIKEWKVMFYIPQIGLFARIDEAVEECKEVFSDTDPRLIIKAVAVAITVDGEAEIVF